jgi:regulator of sigma E protease
MSYVGMIVLLSLLVVIHEAGHLAAARLAGIPVAGFSVGFGPKLWARRWGQVEYSLRAFPLGGFVTPAITDEDEFRAIPLRKRLAFFLGGPLANLVATLPLFAALNVASGPSFYKLIVAPFWQVAASCGQLLGALGGLFSRPETITGVVGIVAQGSQMAQAGRVLEVAISLSISLAVLNLLPIPVLDGGQITMSCLEKAFPPLVRLRVPLTIMGMLVLMALMVYANVHDVIKLLVA